jgi:pyruvate,water dikinase
MDALPLHDDRVVWLDGGYLTCDLVGGKGASLSRLFSLGAPVPPAIGFTTQAYRDFASHLDLAATVRGISEGAHTAVRDLISSAQLPDPIAQTLRRGWSQLTGRIGPDSRLAVRSSAIDEDSGSHSFAGLHDTILGVRHEAEFMAAVRQCWASLWTDRAIAYRRQSGSAEDLAIAVIAQQLVNCDVSFVAFSIDPVSGRSDHAVIDATWGLGESIVSGSVTPDHIVVGPLGDVVDYVIGDKATMIIADAASELGTRQVDVPRVMRKMPALSSDHAAMIARSARDLARQLDHPTDLEGGLVGESLHIFQARPITTLGRTAA